MALKRKSPIDGESPPLKKNYRDVPDAVPKQDLDETDDFKIKYTDIGTPRAESEARRSWVYVCPVEGCTQRFNRPCRLENHIRSHNKERPFACPEDNCDKTFPRRDHLQRHIKNAHSDPAVERSYFCDRDGCDKSFTSNARLQRHKDVHESKFYCTDYPPCNEVFRKANVLEAHIKSQHLQVKPYPCTFVDAETGDACTAGYQTEASLRRHVNNVHSEATEDGHFCMLCTSQDEEQNILDMDYEDAFPISAPPLSFATKGELTAHIEECHPPICSECGQRFRSTSTLKSHWDTVHGDPKQQPQFPCPNPDCGSVFNRKHNLTVHIQSVHNKEQKYFCKSDSQRTSKHDDLKAWKGENACGAAFKAKSSLDQHIRTHHLGLGTRKDLRKASKATKSRKKPDPSMLTLLTGVGYEKGRDVPCLIKTCEYRFYMDRDLRRHLRSAHSLPPDQVELLIAERDALTGGPFWIGGLDDDNDNEHMNTFDSVEPSMPQTPAMPLPMPMPYFFEGGVALYNGTGGEQQLPGTTDTIGPAFSGFDQQFDDLALGEEDAELDKAMGLDGLPPAMDVQDGLGWALHPSFDV